MEDRQFSQFNIEEFKFICDKRKEYESRADKRTLFCISAFGIILGFNGKIEPYLIPYLLSCILMTTISSNAFLGVLRNFTSAYVEKKFYNANDTSYEVLYTQWNKQSRFDNRGNRFITFSLLTHPLSLLFLTSLYSVYYFGRTLLVTEHSFYIQCLYFGGLLVIHAFTLFLRYRNIKYSYSYFEQYMNDNIVNNQQE